MQVKSSLPPPSLELDQFNNVQCSLYAYYLMSIPVRTASKEVRILSTLLSGNCSLELQKSSCYQSRQEEKNLRNKCAFPQDSTHFGFLGLLPFNSFCFKSITNAFKGKIDPHFYSSLVLAKVATIYQMLTICQETLKRRYY